MLHDGHQLNRVVTLALDARYDLLGEIVVGGHTVLWTGDTHMALVDLDVLNFRRFIRLEFVLLRRIPQSMLVDLLLVRQHVIRPR